MLLCVAAFDWPAEAAKAVQGACALQRSSEDAPALRPLLHAEDGSEGDARAVGAHTSRVHMHRGLP